MTGAWAKAVARLARAEAGVEALAGSGGSGGSEDDAAFDRATGRLNAALVRLLGAAAPDLSAVGRKLELILEHQVFELSFGEEALEAVRDDVRRLG